MFALQKFLRTIFRTKVQPTIRISGAQIRARRAAAATTANRASARASGTCRETRGHVDAVKVEWRRGAPGTNRISCIGMWRDGARRRAARVNRMRDTDWHRTRPAFAAHPASIGSKP